MSETSLKETTINVPSRSLTYVNMPADSAPMPLGAYSHGVRAGNFFYLCGMGARDPEKGHEVGVTCDSAGNVLSYDMTVQTKAVINNMKIVLEEAGLGLENLIDVSVYLADMNDFPAYNQVYAEFFSFDNKPVRTTIEAKPPGKNFIEMKGVAYFPE